MRRCALQQNSDVRFGSKADIGARLDHVRFIPKKRTLEISRGMSALCHVWTAPSWQGIFTFAELVGAALCITAKSTRPMSALPPIADIRVRGSDVCFVPKADILRCSKERRYSITSSARASNEGGTFRPSALAVTRLITNSNLFICTTGRSPGFSPLRMRPA